MGDKYYDQRESVHALRPVQPAGPLSYSALVETAQPSSTDVESAIQRVNAELTRQYDGYRRDFIVDLAVVARGGGPAAVRLRQAVRAAFIATGEWHVEEKHDQREGSWMAFKAKTKDGDAAAYYTR